MNAIHRQKKQSEALNGECVLNLDGTWELVLDQADVGRAEGWQNEGAPGSRPARLRITVPACWEEHVPGYDGVGWYFTTFRVPMAFREKFLRLKFESVNYLAEVWLNGKRVGSHEGGYGPFEFDIAHAVKIEGQNRLVVRVGDPGKETPVDGISLLETPHSKESWYYNYGGICGSVTLVSTDPVWIADCFAVPDVANKSVVAEVTVRNALIVRRQRQLLLAGDKRSALLRVEVASKSKPNQVVAATEKKVLLIAGENFFRFPLRLPRPELWHPQHPHLYTMRVALEADGIKHEFETTFGLREFTIEGNKFLLNGDSIYLKSVLYQPYYPKTLVRPQSEEYVRNELRLGKAAGFNMFRAHIRMAPRSFLDAADEMGMLVMAEPSIGWLRGDAPEIKDRALREVEALILRDRNHPSIVVWGMLNELSGVVHKHRASLCRLARRLDPTRLITDDSGGWAGGSYFLKPGETELREYYDDHVYRRGPLSHADREFFRKCGRARKPGFMSEFGFGGLCNLKATLKAFGKDTHLEDYKQYEQFYRSSITSFEENKLAEVFGSYESMIEAGQQVQAESAKVMVNAMRANPRLQAYCFTQFQDVSWECSAGMVDVWCNPKKVFETFKDVNRDFYLCVEGRPANIIAGQKIRLQATLSTHTSLDHGGRLDVRVISPADRTIWTDTKRITAEKPGEVIFDAEIPEEGKTGTYSAKFELAARGGTRTTNSFSFFVVNENDLRTVFHHPVMTWNVSDGLSAAIRRSLVAPAWGEGKQGERGGVIILGQSDYLKQPNELARYLTILRMVREGSVAVMLETNESTGPLPTPPTPIDSYFIDVPLSVKRRISHGHFVGNFHYLVHDETLTGLPDVGKFMGQAYAEVCPSWSYRPVSSANCHVLAGSVDGRGIWLGIDLGIFPYGRGAIIMNTIRLSDQLGRDPIADLLLVRILKAAASRVRPRSSQGVARSVAGGEMKRLARLFDKLGKHLLPFADPGNHKDIPLPITDIERLASHLKDCAITAAADGHLDDAMAHINAVLALPITPPQKSEMPWLG